MTLGFAHAIAVPRAPAPPPGARLPRTPVIFTRPLETTEALEGWTDEYLEATVGDRVVPVEYSLRPVYRPNPKLDGGRYFRTEMPFTECVALLKRPGRPRIWHYLSALAIDRFLPPLMSDLRVPTYLPARRFRGANLFFGPDSTGSQLHYDVTDNFLCVGRGAKRVRLVSPGHLSALHAMSCVHHGCYASLVDVERPDAAKFPRFRDMTVLEALVGPGEMLYIPQGFWHHVINVGLTLGVTYSFRGPRWRDAFWRNARVHVPEAIDRVRGALRHPAP